jgi:hypothetical protein
MKAAIVFLAISVCSVFAQDGITVSAYFNSQCKITTATHGGTLFTTSFYGGTCTLLNDTAVPGKWISKNANGDDVDGTSASQARQRYGTGYRTLAWIPTATPQVKPGGGGNDNMGMNEVEVSGYVASVYATASSSVSGAWDLSFHDFQNCNNYLINTVYDVTCGSCLRPQDIKFDSIYLYVSCDGSISANGNNIAVDDGTTTDGKTQSSSNVGPAIGAAVGVAFVVGAGFFVVKKVRAKRNARALYFTSEMAKTPKRTDEPSRLLPEGAERSVVASNYQSSEQFRV